MLRSKYDVYAFISVLSCLPAMVYADNAWSGYSGVERRSSHQASPSYQQPAQDPFAFSSQRYTPLRHQKAIIISPIKIITTLTPTIDQVFGLNIIQIPNMRVVIAVRLL